MNLLKFKKSNPPKKWNDKKKEKQQVKEFQSGRHYKNDCPSLTKRKSTQSFYESKSQGKVRRGYISQEEDGDYLYSNSILYKEAANMCLMA